MRYPEGDRELVLPQNPMLGVIDLLRLFVFLVWRGHSIVIRVLYHTLKTALGDAVDSLRPRGRRPAAD